MGKRAEDAKAWRSFVAMRLLPRLQRDKERAAAAKGSSSQVGKGIGLTMRMHDNYAQHCVRLARLVTIRPCLPLTTTTTTTTLCKQEARLAVMRRANPTFVLRNWIAQDAIEVR